MANIFVIFGSGISVIYNLGAIIFGRFIYGFSAGCFSVLVPAYITELTPRELKGPFGTIHQVFVTIGIFVVFLIGLPIPQNPDLKHSNEFAINNYWRIIFLVPILISFLQLFLLLTVFKYETPKYYKERKQTDKLNELMAKIYAQHAIQ